MIKMTLNKREIDVVVDTMLYLDAVTADVGQVEVEADEWEDEQFDAAAIVPELDDEWEDTESDDGHRELYQEDYCGYEPYEPNPYDGTYSEMQG